MIFRSGIFSRRDGLSSADFTAHWVNVHGGLARHLPGLRKYLQNHIDERLYERQPFPAHPIDGISQLWFDDLAAMEGAEQSDEYAACKLDIPKFQGAITILVLEANGSGSAGSPAERSEPQPPAKLLWLGTARDTTNTGSKLIGQSVYPHLAAGVRKIVENIVVDRSHPVQAGVPQGEVPADVFVEMWFDDLAALKAWHASPEGRAAIYANPAVQPLSVYAAHEITVV
jgi:uncharacterized protein (TIGR02118 family)